MLHSPNALVMAAKRSAKWMQSTDFVLYYWIAVCPVKHPLAFIGAHSLRKGATFFVMCCVYAFTHDKLLVVALCLYICGGCVCVHRTTQSLLLSVSSPHTHRFIGHLGYFTISIREVSNRLPLLLDFSFLPFHLSTCFTSPWAEVESISLSTFRNKMLFYVRSPSNTCPRN